MELLLRLFISIFLGFIVGIDRDDSWQDKKVTLSSRFTFMRPGKPAKGLGGVRTFTLISILGFISGAAFSFSPWLGFIGFVSFLALVILITSSYFLNFLDKNTLGLTTEVSIFTLFVLSFLIGAGFIDYKIGLGIGVIISLLLSLKIEVRKAVASFTKREIIESLEFILLTVVIFPWLPNVDVKLKNFFDLFQYSNPALNDIVLFNPQGLWLVVIFVTSLNFIGYFLVKILKDNKSLLITGLLGGLVSSTTVTQLMAMRSKAAEGDKETTKLLVATALIANSTSFVRIPILALLLNKDLFGVIIVSMIFMTIVGFLTSILSVRKSTADVESGIIFESPLAIKSAIVFAIMFVSVQIITQFGLMFFGKAGFAVSTLIASASGLDAVTINTSKSIPALISIEFGALVLLGAVVINLIFKLIMTLLTGTAYFNRKLTMYFTAIIISGIIGLIIMLI